METKEGDKPIQKYECRTCGTVVTNERDKEPVCVCKKPNLILLAKEYTDDEMAEVIKKYRCCYEDMIKVLDYYLELPESYKKIISLWIVGTYVHKEFNSYPFLFLNAMRGSGKTRALNIISHLAWNGKMTNNITEAVLFRTAKDHTIVIDENEAIIKKEKSGLRELLNSAYKKGARVERMRKIKEKDGDKQIVEQFELYTPVAMANISGMEEVLGDRCITLILEKSDNPAKTKLMEDFDDNPIFSGIKRTFDLNQCSFCNVVSLKKLKRTWNNYIKCNYTNYIYTYNTYNTYNTNNNPEEEYTISSEELDLFKRIEKLDIDGRNLELFFPLINICYVLGDDLVDELLKIIKTLITTRKRDEYTDSPDIALYEFVAKKDVLQFYPVTDLLLEFKAFFVADEGDRDWLNSKWFGRALRRLNLVLDDRRESRGMKVILDIGKAKDKMKMFTHSEKEVTKTMAEETTETEETSETEEKKEESEDETKAE